jgi:hypothetical protein
VEDVEFHRGHSVQGVFEYFDRNEMASAVDHEAAPAEAWRVLNRYGGNKQTSCVGLNQLLQGCEPVHRPNHSSRA